jgi:curli biogenesis system outer membrane secretion channel CsgG
LKKAFVCMGVLLILGLALVAAGRAADQEKPRIGVLRFTNQTSAGWWSASVGTELSDMLASELVSTRSFSVLERKEIDAVIGEQDLGGSGRIDPATKAKIGKIKGAKYLVAGTVSSYEQNTSGGGGGVSIGGLSLGGKKEKTYVAVDVKVIDTETGEIVDARTIEGEASGSGMGGSLSIAGVSLHGGGFEKTPAGKAIRGCIVYISDYLECSLVRGKDDRCMQKWDDMDKARRERTRGAIDIR